MIETEVSIHDNFSLEFKTGFRTDNKQEDINEFKINMWIFAPNSLDLNSTTYSKSQFYKDVKKNIRLITPIYSLDEILKEGRGPLPRLQKAIDALLINPEDSSVEENFLYQIKMLQCVFKSALYREVQEMNFILDKIELERLIVAFVNNLREFVIRYREEGEDLDNPAITQKQLDYFSFGDDFMGNTLEQYSFQVLHLIDQKDVCLHLKPMLLKLIADEVAYRKQRGYRLLIEGDEEHNSMVIWQRMALKKFVESDLYLHTIKKKDGAVAEQVYYGIAAGIAMIFATVISFFATQRLGNFTMDLFVVLVISYIFKDRIKDVARYYFSSVLSKRYFDTKLSLSVRNQEIGWMKESFDFVQEAKVPEAVMNLRNRTPLVEAENEIYNENVILYRKWVTLSREEIEKYKEYRLSGINDFTRINLMNFVQKMDNPSIPLSMYDNSKGDYKDIKGTKIYLLYFILQFDSDSGTEYKKYRVLFNRNGITNVRRVN